MNANQYNYQDVSNWRDLNSKYVLMVWRDYDLGGGKDTAFLQYTWNAVKQAMEHLRQYDTDGDGLIKNGGFPDQTYDNWVARGESAYSGGLYLGALRATAEIARKLDEVPTASTMTRSSKKRSRPTSKISGTAPISIMTREYHDIHHGGAACRAVVLPVSPDSEIWFLQICASPRCSGSTTTT